MALVTRWFVEVGTSYSDGSVSHYDARSVHDGFDEANEAAVALVAHGAAKDAVRVFSALAFDDSHEIEPAAVKSAVAEVKPAD